MADRVRVLIVDDSPTIRRLVRLALSSDPRIDIVGEAQDPLDARAKIKSLSPDVLTLDVEMPQMNGLDFLERLMRLRPMPVVMLSTLTHRGSAAAVAALSLGAVGCVGKPDGVHRANAFAGLAETVVVAARARVRGPSLAMQALRPVAAGSFCWNGKIVLIGASTGGVEALETILARLPADCPPILITQHMPPGFLASFADRLSSRIAPKVRVAADGAEISQGQVLIAPGGECHLLLNLGDPLRCRLVTGPPESGHRPSVDAMMTSALPQAQRVVAVMLTGMGRDGATAMAALRAAGAYGIAQDEASSVVFGMPRVAIELGGADAVLPLEAIGDEILRQCSAATEASARSTACR
jgi:two-component system, chemotaxis family, protein-glutamate methylesterase/glutaminase